jgi:TP901 family phage tail tape measure protein
MADLEKTVSILFKGVDEISSTMNSIGGGFTSFGSSLEAATQSLADMAAMIEKIDVGLLIMAAGGMVAATNAAGEFETGMNLIHTLLRESPEDIEAFDAAIEEYARNSTQSIDDIQKAIYQALSANVEYGKSIAFVTEAEKLAVAGQSTLTESVDLLTGTMTAYGAAWEDANQYADVFFKTVEIGKVTIPELSQSLALVTPIAAASGVSIEEVTAAIAALTAGGIAAGPSAEYLRQAIQSIIDPSKESRATMDELGISYGASAIEANGFSGVMKEVYDATGGNVDVLAKMFGNVQALTVAVTLGKDQSGYYAKALDEIANSSGATSRAYEIMVGNFENVNTRLMNSMQLALIEIGKPLLDDWANVANGLGEVFKEIKVGLSDGAFDEIYNQIEKFAGEFGDYLRDVAEAIPEAMESVDFDAFLQSITELGGAVSDMFSALFGDLDLTKPEDLAVAMQKIVDGVTALTNVTKGIVEGLQPFVEKLGQLATEAVNADGSTQELTGKIFGFGQGLNIATTALNFMAPALAILSGSLVVNAISTLGTLGTTIGLFSVTGGVAAVAAAGLLGIGYAANSLNPPISLATAKFDEFGNLIGDFNNMAPETTATIGELSNLMNDLPEVKTFTINPETGEATEKINELNTSILSFPADFLIEPTVESTQATQSIGELSMMMADYSGKEYTADFFVEANQESIEKFKGEIETIINPDGTVTFIDVQTKPGSVQKVKDSLNEIPTEKMMEIKLQGDIDKELATIKSNADNMQTAMEWTAKLEIAQIEAETEKVKAMFSSVSDTIGSVSSEIANLFGKVPKSEYDFGAREWQASVKQAMKIQEEGFKLEKALVEQQIRLMKQKEDAIWKGKALIKIDSTGLEPALEMIMWQILQKVQLKANEDAASFLLGI